MPKHFLIALIFFCFGFSEAQTILDGDKKEWITFEDTSIIKEYIKLDTNKGNIWRIGKPAKFKFNSAFTPQNAIVTDLKGYYPTNTHSSFIMKFFYKYDVPEDTRVKIGIEGNYKIDSDSLNDYGIVEMSDVKGKGWIDILNNYSDSWVIDNEKKKPVFTGNLSDTWHNFSFTTDNYFATHAIDTLWFRFTFVSDSIDNHKEGWIIDNLVIIVYKLGGIEGEDQKNNLISLFPNPVNRFEQLNIISKNSQTSRLQIFNPEGKSVYKNDVSGEQITIDMHSFQPGFYFAEITDSSGRKAARKLVVY